MDSLTLAISQGSLRRGSAACYLDISHPEIEEFLEIRKPSGDFNRKALNLHHGVLVTDEFMEAVRAGAEFILRSPKDGSERAKVDARSLFQKLVETRLATGEPYIIFIDAVNKAMPKHHRDLGLKVSTSNLCSEITLPTGRDHLGADRTAVCCLSSLNLETWDEWNKDKLFIEDVMRFLDNVLSDYIARAPDEMARAEYSRRARAQRRPRSYGLPLSLQQCSVLCSSRRAPLVNRSALPRRGCRWPCCCTTPAPRTRSRRRCSKWCAGEWPACRSTSPSSIPAPRRSIRGSRPGCRSGCGTCHSGSAASPTPRAPPASTTCCCSNPRACIAAKRSCRCCRISRTAVWMRCGAAAACRSATSTSRTGSAMSGRPLAGTISRIGSHVLSLACLALYGRFVTDTLSGVRAVRAADVLDRQVDRPGGRQPRAARGAAPAQGGDPRGAGPLLPAVARPRHPYHGPRWPARPGNPHRASALSGAGPSPAPGYAPDAPTPLRSAK